MAKIKGGSGALFSLVEIVGDATIQTLNNVLDFKMTFEEEKIKAIALAREDVKLEIAKKDAEIDRLSKDLQHEQSQFLKSNLFIKFFRKTRIYALQTHLRLFRETLLHEQNDIDGLAQRRAASRIAQLERVSRVLNENQHLIQGAIAEEKIIEVLGKLSNSFTVINDLRMQFDPPIYNKKIDDRIYSIQIDHVVIGPTGIFLIETKNWSNYSIQRDDLFSPVKQVKRSAFAMFVYLNSRVEAGELDVFETNWGKRKISPRQIVVSMKAVPYTDFDFVKVLNPENLQHHLTHARHEFKSEEIEAISSLLLNERRQSRITKWGT